MKCLFCKEWTPTKKQIILLKILKQNPSTKWELHKQTGRAYSHVHDNIKVLTTEGYLLGQIEPSEKNRIRYRYYLTKGGIEKLKILEKSK